MIDIDQLRDDLNRINWLLDQAEASESSEAKYSRLQQAAKASLRILDALSGPPSVLAVLDPTQHLSALHMQHKNNIDETAKSLALFGAFVQAESRLLSDLGLEPGLVIRIEHELLSTQTEIRDRGWPPTDWDGRLQILRTEISAEVESAFDEYLHQRQHERRVGRVKKVVLVGSGAMIIAANSLVASGTAAVTGGLSIAGAAVSASAGAIRMDRGCA